MNAVSRIAEVEAIPLRAGVVDPADLDASNETLVVRITDEDGRSGIGETDAPLGAVRELVLMDDVFAWSRGLRSALLGSDPFEISALGAPALRGDDLPRPARTRDPRAFRGRHRPPRPRRQAARPARLPAPRRRPSGRPDPVRDDLAGRRQGRSLDELMEEIGAQFRRALELGFRAVKMEVVFGELVSDRELVECIREGRRLLGDDVTLALDFGYRWSDWRSALWVLDRVEDCDIYFAEATLRHDDLEGHARLAERVETRVAGAELAATVDECREWLERGRVDVLQPDVNRCGGLTELRRIAELALLHGAVVIPHGWKTGITAAAERHFQAATENAPLVEMLSPHLYRSPLRAELVRPEPEVRDGTIPLPTEPGLGIELVEEAVESYRVG